MVIPWYVAVIETVPIVIAVNNPPSGWVNAAMKNYFRDFLLSPEVYEIVGDDLLPTVVTTKKTALLKDKEGLIFFECECERAYTDKYFSNPFKAGKWKDSGTFLDSGSWSDSQ